MGDDVRSHTRKVCPGFIHVLFMDADGKIPLLIDTVAGAADFGQQHVVIFLTVMVQPVLFHRDQQGMFKFFFVDPAVVQRDLGGRTGIQCIQKFRIIKEHLCLIRFACDSIIDIRKPE